MAVEVMAEEASGQCARACGARTHGRRACLRRERRACATPLPQGGAKAESSAHGQRDGIVCLTNSAASAFVCHICICRFLVSKYVSLKKLKKLHTV